MNPMGGNGQMAVMKGSGMINGGGNHLMGHHELGSGSRHSLFQANMHDDNNPNNLLDMLSQNTPDSGMLRMRDDEVDSNPNRSGSDNNDGGSPDDDNQDTAGKDRKRKKRYNRHTQHQIQEMEAFFRECPHPDDKQRKELARELGLEPLQVKFWFQNKRTQVKNQHERSENNMLRSENEKLRSENMRYKEMISAATCPTCGGPATIAEMSFDEQNLRIENARLRDEINRLSAIAAKYVGKSALAPTAYSPPNHHHHHQMPMPQLDHGVGGLGIHPSGELDVFEAPPEILSRPMIPVITEADKPMVIELAVSAMEELLRLGQLGLPMWIPGPDGVTDVLSEEEYYRVFPKVNRRSSEEGFRTEATRANAVVLLNHFSLVEMLMDANQWSNLFHPIVSRATTLEVFSTGIAGNYNGALQVMLAEFHAPSPVVPTRESLFVRYCKQHSDGTWAVADVSLDHHWNPSSNRFRRMPSGCLIQEMPNGYSKVTWVEHIQMEEALIYGIFKEIIKSGLGFGAKRWISTLSRQSERLASAMATQVFPGDVVGEGRKSMLKLAERMVKSFGTGVSASNSHNWSLLCGTGDEDVRVMTRKSINDPGRPSGIVLGAALSFWLPISPKRIFDFLRDENTRNEVILQPYVLLGILPWDILSNGGFVQEIAHVANGQDPGNCISLLRVHGPNSSQGNMLILQESCIDESGCLVVYAPVDGGAINAVLNANEDPDYVALLPSGFVLTPDGQNTAANPNECGGSSGSSSGGGTLATVSFQILVTSIPTSKLDIRSVTTVNSLINCTVSRIKAALVGDNA